MDKLKFGIVGLGTIAQKAYLPKIRGLKFAEVAAVCDIDAKKATATGKELSVSGYDNLGEMLTKEKLDFIVALTPHDQYHKIIEAASKKNIHIFKEKPFATSLDEGLYYCKISKKYGIEIATAVQRRASSLHASFLDFNKKAGTPFSLSINYTTLIANAYEGWRARKIQVGGCLFDMGYHMIDLLLWYFGMPDTVQAFSSASTTTTIADADDTATVLFKYSNGLFGYLHTSRVLIPKSEQLTLLGSEGIIDLSRERISLLNRQGAIVEQIEKPYELAELAITQIDQFCDGLKGNTPKINTADEHLQHVAVAETCYNSEIALRPQSPTALLNSKQVKMQNAYARV